MRARTLCLSLCLSSSAAVPFTAYGANIAPKAAPKTTPSKDEEIQSLKKALQQQQELIQKLTSRIEKLESAKTEPGQPAPATSPSVKPVAPAEPPASDEPPIPEPEIPGESPAPASPPSPGETPAVPPEAVSPGADEPPIPDVQIPGADTSPQTPSAPATNTGGPTAGTSRASLLPDISVIGNNVGRFLSVGGDHDRNRFQLGEFEIGLQQPVYEGIRFDAFLAGDAEEDFSLKAEEAYATFSSVGGLPFGAYLGKKRLDFGKINPVHPHARAYADQPAVISNFLGPDGVGGNGASVNYLLPVKKVFANLELGLWKVDPLDEGFTLGEDPAATFYPVGLGVTNNFTSGRLWLSKEFGNAGELELGASHGFGKADVGDNIRLTGLDFTYRNFPGTFKRLLLQGEAMWHQREDGFGGTGDHTRAGQYLLLTYRPDEYKEFGLRLDNASYPWPITGHERSASLIWTNHLSEGTLVRLQYKYGNRTSDVLEPAAKGFNNLYLQFIWAAGSHTHPLQ